MLLFLILFYFGSSSFAQINCGTNEYEEFLNQNILGYEKAINKTRTEYFTRIERNYKSNTDTEIYYIPVVFHIIWNTPEQNISDTLILSQVKALNEAFSHTHRDTTNLRSTFKPNVGKSKIVFFCAKTNPFGKETNGINRIYTNVKDFSDSKYFLADKVKLSSQGGVNPWDPSRYLNVWICKFTDKGKVKISAYAYPPTNAKYWPNNSNPKDKLQGIVINSEFIGVNNPLDIYSGSLREKTLVHEVGHYLGLRHIWADKIDICSYEDDGIDDTPLCKTPSFKCDITKNSCVDSINDKPDMIENYMDYTSYPCTVMFTQNQVQMMRFNLINLRTKLTLNNQIKLSITPNPVIDKFQIQFTKKGQYKIIVYNMTGQEFLVDDFFSETDFNFKNYQPNFEGGIYFIKILLENSLVHYSKLVIFLQ